MKTSRAGLESSGWIQPATTSRDGYRKKEEAERGERDSFCRLPNVRREKTSANVRLEEGSAINERRRRAEVQRAFATVSDVEAGLPGPGG